jgi:trimeric autotransporter adhesin
MASITTRETGTTGTGGVTRKNLPLTNAEIDTNFINLNTDKLEASYTGNANLVTLGTVTTGTWNATTIATTRGGTGLTSFTNGGAVYATSTSALTTGTLPATAGGTGVTSSGGNGNLLIGNSSNGWTVATLTGTSNRITVTNSSGGITLSTPQDIATGSNLQFNSLGIGTASSGTPGEIRATNQITSYYSDERLKDQY